MRHLDAERLGDAIDGRLDRTDAAHLETCAPCRARVAELRTVLQQVTSADVPAPSPLFWEHFRARVAGAIDEPGSARTPWFAGARFRWLTAASAVVTIALVTLTVSLDPARSGDPGRVAGGALVPLAPVTENAGAADLVEDDEAWALVRSLAEDLDYDSAHDAGVTPAPGAVERAAAELSATERTALVQLLEQEMKRTDS